MLNVGGFDMAIVSHIQTEFPVADFSPLHSFAFNTPNAFPIFANHSRGRLFTGSAGISLMNRWSQNFFLFVPRTSC